MYAELVGSINATTTFTCYKPGLRLETLEEQEALELIQHCILSWLGRRDRWSVWSGESNIERRWEANVHGVEVPQM